MKNDFITKTIEEFRDKFIKGTLPYDVPGGFGVQEAEAWIEADIEEFEDWIYSKLEQQRELFLQAIPEKDDPSMTRSHLEEFWSKGYNQAIDEIKKNLEEI